MRQTEATKMASIVPGVRCHPCPSLTHPTPDVQITHTRTPGSLNPLQDACFDEAPAGPPVSNPAGPMPANVLPHALGLEALVGPSVEPGLSIGKTLGNQMAARKMQSLIRGNQSRAHLTPPGGGAEVAKKGVYKHLPSLPSLRLPALFSLVTSILILPSPFPSLVPFQKEVKSLRRPLKQFPERALEGRAAEDSAAQSS